MRVRRRPCWAAEQTIRPSRSVAADDYALLTDDGKFAQVGELSRSLGFGVLLADSGNLLQMEEVTPGQRFDVLLTANGFGRALLRPRP